MANYYQPPPIEKYLLAEEDWKQDVIPEIMDGHNIMDFIDPEIAERLERLEREEEELEAKGHYESDEEEADEDMLRLRKLANKILEKKQLMIKAHRMSKNKNRPTVPMKVKAKSAKLSDMSSKLTTLGLDTTMAESNEALRGARKRGRSTAAMDTVRSASTAKAAPQQGRSASKRAAIAVGSASNSEFSAAVGTARSVSCVRDRSNAGLRNVKQKMESVSIHKKAQRPNNLEARKGEADRRVLTAKPKHLFAGKRGAGKTDRR